MVVKPPEPLMLPGIVKPPVLPKLNVVIFVSVTGPLRVLEKLLPPVMVVPLRKMLFGRLVRLTWRVALGLMVSGPVPKNGVTVALAGNVTVPALRTVPPLYVLLMLLIVKTPVVFLVSPPLPEIRLLRVTEPPPLPPKLVMAARFSGVLIVTALALV